MDENTRKKKKLEELLNSVWPKDPLSEKRSSAQFNLRTEGSTVGGFLEDMSHDEANQTKNSEIKSSLKRIQDTELMLSDMISRHIKKVGTDKFSNSSFVVTNRANFSRAIEQSSKEAAAGAGSNRQRGSSMQNAHSKDRAVAQHRHRKKKISKPQEIVNAEGKKVIVEPLDVHNKLKQIINEGDSKYEITQREKVHSLSCFRPKELFNINTHGLFMKEKNKDPLDSDYESDDDEEEIQRLLQDNDIGGPILGIASNDIKNAKIDIHAYDPNKSIDHNIKVLRSMINRAKQVTNTNRGASMAQNRKESLKMSKFIKKDFSMMQASSKIARDTEEAIKYLNKRQPLAVQNSKEVDDDQLFSLPHKRRAKKKSQDAMKTNYTMPTQREFSQSPPKELQLAHTGSKAKFFRFVPGNGISGNTGNQNIHDLVSQTQVYNTQSDVTSANDLQSTGKFQRIKSGQGTGFNTVKQDRNATQTQRNPKGRTITQYSPLKSGKTSRSQNMQRPSIYSRSDYIGKAQRPNNTNIVGLSKEEQSRQIMNIYSGTADIQNQNQSVQAHDQLENQGTVPGPAIMNVQRFNPVMINNAQIVNNITVMTANKGQQRQVHNNYQNKAVTTVGSHDKFAIKRTGSKASVTSRHQYKNNQEQPHKSRVSSGVPVTRARTGVGLSSDQTTRLGSRAGHRRFVQDANSSEQLRDNPESQYQSINFHPASSQNREKESDDSTTRVGGQHKKRYLSSALLSQNEMPKTQNQRLNQVASTDQVVINGNDGLVQGKSRFYRHNRFQSTQANAIGPLNMTGQIQHQLQESDSGLMGRINEAMESKRMQESQDQYLQNPYWQVPNNQTTDLSYETAGLPVQGDQYGLLLNASSSNAFMVNQAFKSDDIMSRKKSSAVIKVDKTVLEKEPTLGLMDMLRILDARNADMGLKKLINTSSCTPDSLDKLIKEFTEDQSSGPAQRFKDYCDQKCFNRKLVLQGFSLGPLASQEISNILAVNRDIAHVDLSTNNLQDAGVETLCRVIKSNKSIMHLDLMQNNITSKGVKKLFKALTNNVSLVQLKIGNTENVSKNRINIKAVKKLNTFLKTSKTLCFLDLRSMNLTDSGLSMLCDGLTDNKTLFNLNLSKNDITQTSIEKFAQILYRTAISELDLSLNPLGNNGIRCLAENLYEKIHDERRTKRGQKCALTKLNLSETKFQEQGSYALFRNLIDFHQMTNLVLDYNQFESKNMTLFTNYIKSTRLNTLSINYCKLGDNGGTALGEALSLSSYIRDVRAKKNEFRDATAKAIAQAIEENSMVERLDLSSNLINDSGGELIGLSLSVNQNLHYLNLRKNNLRATSGAMFAQSMKENKTLKCLKLQKNSINLNFLEDIDRYIERNNIHLLENNVNELKQDRNGYLSTRDHAWREVSEKNVENKAKTAKLERDVSNLTQKKDLLGSDLDREVIDLDESLAYYRTLSKQAYDQLTELGMEIRRAENQAEKQSEAHEHALNQANFLIDNCRDQIEQKKQILVETQENYEAQERKAESALYEANKKRKQAEREKNQIKQEIEQLIAQSRAREDNTEV